MWYPAYNVRYSLVPINSSLLTTTLYYSVTIRLLYKDTEFLMTSWTSTYIFACRFVCVWNLVAQFGEERRLRVFESRVLRRIFGHKRDDVKREWRNLHNEELNGLYFSSNIILVMKSRVLMWAVCVARMGERRIQGFGGETWWNRPLGRPRRGWEDNIKRYLQEMGCGGMEWIELAQDWDRWRALVNAVMNLRVP